MMAPGVRVPSATGRDHAGEAPRFDLPGSGVDPGQVVADVRGPVVEGETTVARVEKIVDFRPREHQLNIPVGRGSPHAGREILEGPDRATRLAALAETPLTRAHASLEEMARVEPVMAPRIQHQGRDRPVGRGLHMYQVVGAREQRAPSYAHRAEVPVRAVPGNPGALSHADCSGVDLVGTARLGKRAPKRRHRSPRAVDGVEPTSK